jgi:hypothetical protein
MLNSYRDRCLDILKLFDTFSIKHIPWEENSKANRLAQQASGYVVAQGFFWVTSVSLVENRYQLRSKGKPMLDNVDRLQDKGKSTLDKEAKEESVMKKSEFKKVGSPLDNETTKPIRVDDLAKDGATVRADWRLPLMECIRDPGKITDKKLKRQLLKYTLLDDDLLMACC